MASNRACMGLRTRQTSRLLLQLLSCAFLVILFAVTATADVRIPQANTIAPSKTGTRPLTSTATPSRVLPTQTRSPRFSSASYSVPGQPQVDANTIALYHFDAPSGNIAIDATGNYTGTLHGNATITTSGLYAGVLVLDGNGSYVRTGHLGNVISGTIEAFVDFRAACNHSESFPIITAINGAGETVLNLGVRIGLMFGMYANGKWNWADSGINPCRYLNGPQPPAGDMWPYETWRFHHVAGTWGPRGMEIWVDGVLHGVGNDDPGAYTVPYPYMCNPQMQMGQVPGGNDLYPRCKTPVMYPTMTVFPRGDYTGGLAPYSTFRIGCDPTFGCLVSSIDEVRFSNIQRTFEWTVVPTVTPLPTWTPVSTSGEYVVDANTRALFHLDFESYIPPFVAVLEEVSGRYGVLNGQASIVPNGHFDAGLSLDGNGSHLDPGNLGYLGAGTVEAWVNFSAPFGSQPILPVRRYYYWDLVLSLGTLSSGNIGFYFSDGVEARSIDSGASPAGLAGCWHHIAGTWGSRGLEIWIDGSLRNADPSYTKGMTYGDYTWRVGCDFAGNCVKGRLDEVRVSMLQRTFAPPQALQRPFAPRQATPRLRAPASEGTLTFLPLIQVAPTPSCLYGE